MATHLFTEPVCQETLALCVCCVTMVQIQTLEMIFKKLQSIMLLSVEYQHLFMYL